jgi:hypothetical protein
MQMVPFMKVPGTMIRDKVSENSLGMMEVTMSAISKMI